MSALDVSRLMAGRYAPVAVVRRAIDMGYRVEQRGLPASMVCFDRRIVLSDQTSLEDKRFLTATALGLFKQGINRHVYRVQCLGAEDIAAHEFAWSVLIPEGFPLPMPGDHVADVARELCVPLRAFQSFMSALHAQRA